MVKDRNIYRNSGANGVIFTTTVRLGMSKVMYRGFWIVTRPHMFGVNRRFGTTFCPFFRVNEERAKSSPETSVNNKNMTPGNNPEASIHNNNHGESLQTHMSKVVS